MTYNTKPRRSLSKKRRAEFLQAHNATCYWCGLPIVDDLWDVEHTLARELGGSDEPENLKPIHRLQCHKEKSAADKALIAKGNRIRKYISGLDPIKRKPSKAIWSRGFSQGQRSIPSRPFPRRKPDGKR